MQFKELGTGIYLNLPSIIRVERDNTNGDHTVITLIDGSKCISGYSVGAVVEMIEVGISRAVR